MQFTPHQQQAITLIADRWDDKGRLSRVSVAGYAGTGKTTIVRAAIEEIQRRHDGKVNVCYACYTGKAAGVLRSKLPAGEHVSTLHRLLYDSKPMKRTCSQKEASKLRLKEGDFSILPNGTVEYTTFVHEPKASLECDIVVIDEASMVTVELWKQLRRHNVMLISLGDPAQLPPIIKDDELPQLQKVSCFSMEDAPGHHDVFLTEIMRQGADSSIVALSMIARCDCNKPLAYRTEHRFECPIRYGMTAQDYIITGKYHAADIFREYLSDIIADGVDLSAHTMVCYRNDERHRINLWYHRRLGFATDNIEVGDRVVCRSNNYDLTGSRGTPVVNGLMAIVREIKKEVTRVWVPDEPPECIQYDIFASFTDDTPRGHWEESSELKCILESDGEEFTQVPLRTLELAYCLTVHKSQGSEWDKVVVFDNFNWSWTPDYAKWIYTAVTRARRYLVILQCKLADTPVG